MGISKFMAPEIIFGFNSLEQVGESVLRLGAKKVFIVSDPGVVSAGWVEEAIHYLKQCKLDCCLWTSVTSNPKDYEVAAGVAEYTESGCNAVVGIGGGSAIDAAKSIALLGSNGGSIRQYEGVDLVLHPLPPMVMVPTTAGSGSEVSQFSIVVDTERKVKMTIVSKSLIPDIAIVDPRTLMTKDRKLTAHTGMDALTHAIESYISLAATPLTEGYSLQAMRLISEFLRPSVASQHNREAKEAMAMASLQAGIAFSNAILGAVHAMSHQLGGLLDLPHGEVNAILLPHVMEFNLISTPEKYKKIACAFGENVNSLSPADAAKLAIKAVKSLADDLGIPHSLPIRNLEEDTIELLSQNAVQDACMITNPRDLSAEDVKMLFHKVLGSGHQ
ncbi:iron-containing alcohol dehydrogenase [Effusibacillus lacus]|uniref:Alcohol dehydrogenase n=1 Tax=Effusibacillus lacus TaxID=1348429 RepID=A0A292YBX5_9BACL|nr:iron-containing alcohol dehydrogenase [Effusibacillus lacus]TCS74740.1 alcohol dehydrogenase class IV [Effusibacillus lacus]GAX88552.1 alcohol dehydrogenase [Effusibacillus lacus]